MGEAMGRGVAELVLFVAGLGGAVLFGRYVYGQMDVVASLWQRVGAAVLLLLMVGVVLVVGIAIASS
jgi:hypothetical protein